MQDIQYKTIFPNIENEILEKWRQSDTFNQSVKDRCAIKIDDKQASLGSACHVNDDANYDDSTTT